MVFAVGKVLAEKNTKLMSWKEIGLEYLQQASFFLVLVGIAGGFAYGIVKAIQSGSLAYKDDSVRQVMCSNPSSRNLSTVRGGT